MGGEQPEEEDDVERPEQLERPAPPQIRGEEEDGDRQRCDGHPCDGPGAFEDGEENPGGEPGERAVEDVGEGGRKSFPPAARRTVLVGSFGHGASRCGT